MMKKHILVIDDEKSIRMLLENFLSKNYKVTSKTDGMDALNWMQEGNLPDLIVADIKMPNIDGYDFIKNIRASGYFKDIPLISIPSAMSILPA
ncbi:MAG: response regulator [Bacteroidales bacterium]|nr:response regulator [Bacteroidales bacterium]